MDRLPADGAAHPLFARLRGREKTVHALTSPLNGGKLRFTNTLLEEPIGELSAYHVSGAAEPCGQPQACLYARWWRGRQERTLRAWPQRQRDCQWCRS